MRRYAVVGAFGFLGRSVVRSLDSAILIQRGDRPETANGKTLIWCAGSRPPAESYERNAADLDAFLDRCRPLALVLASSLSVPTEDSAYARSKSYQEQVAISHGIPHVRIARLASLYGNERRDEPTDRLAVLDRWIRLARNGSPLECRAGARADMMHVDDAGRVIADMAQGAWGGFERWDVGSGTPWGLRKLAQQVCAISRVGIVITDLEAEPDPDTSAGSFSSKWWRSSTYRWEPPAWIDHCLLGPLEGWVEPSK